uniref:Tudor domain-containing protein n=1 Tax=Macrostomum lignano TaxID=282301 RepID=A0A1I8I3V0_9PLAT
MSEQRSLSTAVQQSENNNDQSLENKNYSSDGKANNSNKLRIDCRRSSGDSNKSIGNQAKSESDADDSGRPSSVDTDPRSPCATAAAATAVSGEAKKSTDKCDSSLPVRGVSPVPGDENDVVHQFLIPNRLGGSMVGTRGRNINYIRAKSGASVWISRNFFDKKTQVVNVRGPVECVKCALQVIKKRFPELDVKPINTAVPIHRNPALQPTMCQLTLPDAVHVDVVVSAACFGTTLFLQQPGHPTYQQLAKMDGAVRRHYASSGQQSAAVPPLPRPVNPGAVCVAPSAAVGDDGENIWHRAIIADVFPESDSVLMKFLDWGGYEQMPVGKLRQIR